MLLKSVYESIQARLDGCQASQAHDYKEIFKHGCQLYRPYRVVTTSKLPGILTQLIRSEGTPRLYSGVRALRTGQWVQHQTVTTPSKMLGSSKAAVQTEPCFLRSSMGQMVPTAHATSRGSSKRSIIIHHSLKRFTTQTGESDTGRQCLVDLSRYTRGP